MQPGFINLLLISGRHPKLSDLQELVIPPACFKWEEIGIALKLGDDDDGAYLDGLDAKYKTDEKRFQDVLKKWLRESSKKKSSLKPATWGCLLEILTKVDLKDLVKEVMDHLKGIAALLSNNALMIDVLSS